MSWTNDEEIAMMHPVDAFAKRIEGRENKTTGARRGEEGSRKQQEKGEEAPDLSQTRMCQAGYD